MSFAWNGHWIFNIRGAARRLDKFQISMHWVIYTIENFLMKNTDRTIQHSKQRFAMFCCRLKGHIRFFLSVCELKGALVDRLFIVVFSIWLVGNVLETIGQFRECVSVYNVLFRSAESSVGTKFAFAMKFFGPDKKNSEANKISKCDFLHNDVWFMIRGVCWILCAITCAVSVIRLLYFAAAQPNFRPKSCFIFDSFFDLILNWIFSPLKPIAIA